MRKILLAALLAIVTFNVLNLKNTSRIFDDEEAGRIYQIFLERYAEEETPAMLATKYRMYNMLCFELRDIDCGDTPAPNVKTFKQNPFRPGLMGYYNGGDIIYIRQDLRGKDREEVLAHEMSHYLDVMLFDLEVPSSNVLAICTSEKVAWAVSDAYWTKYNYPKYVVGKTWTEWYSHCTPLVDELYPE
jgi:hypothetical protein